MTTQQDILRTMMTQLDEASDKIPEGLYLQFCDHLQNLHNKTGPFCGLLGVGHGRHQTRVGTIEAAPQIPPNEHGYVDVHDYQEAIDRMGPRRPQRPRRCGRCRQVGHDRRNCPQVARDYVEEANRIRASESPVEVLEREPVIRINDREWRSRPSRNPPRCSIVVEVDLPGVDNFRELQWSYTAPFPGARDVLHIRVPGKYKADIRLPGRKNCGSKGSFSSRRQMLTVTIPML